MDKIEKLAINIIKMLSNYDETLADFFIQLDKIDKNEFLEDLCDIIFDWTEGIDEGANEDSID